MSVQTNDTIVPHSSYENTTRACYDTQSQVTDAWVDGKYPSHNVVHYGGSDCPPELMDHMDATVLTHAAELYSSPNFRGYQFPDGSGILLHYDTIEAVRTPRGKVYTNQQCWSTGFAHCSAPHGDDSDGTAPLSDLGTFLDDTHTIMDITDVYRVEGDSRIDDRVIEINHGEYGVYAGLDPSITSGDRYFMFRLTTDELQSDNPLSALTPSPVKYKDMDVVTSDEFTESRLGESERQAHVEAGGELSESHSRWRDDPINRQSYRADLQGNVIVRQGEYFFIPVPDHVVPDKPVYKPLSNSWSHFDPMPSECPGCNGTSFDVESGGTVHCNGCDEVWHTDSDESPDWGGNHTPRDLILDGTTVYVRGTVRHGDGDHDMINLGETWHAAVSHDRNVAVYRTGIPDDHIGNRERNGMRWD
jgi:hypothetical protein